MNEKIKEALDLPESDLTGEYMIKNVEQRSTEEQLKEFLDRPWNLLPYDIRKWVRDNGYVIRENYDENSKFLSSIVKADWRGDISNKTSKLFYPPLVSREVLVNRWKEEPIPNLFTWKDLHIWLKYRADTPTISMFRKFNSNKSGILIY